MNLNQFVGRTFDEVALFQQLLFEVENNKEIYRNKFYHLMLEPQDHGNFFISESLQYESYEAQSNASEANFKKRHWIEVYSRPHAPVQHIIWIRPDLTAWWAQIWPYGVVVSKEAGFIDMSGPKENLTAEEIRQGFKELCSIVEELPKGIKLKKAI